ncbi:tyrosine-protein phosphatase [Sediminicola sp. 1XM1-17]|uniref:tyrosine-protein phosphatase n=1 Tax=Sediminicola sp. 1XM1-17 TaxID=3127702 RepID=UPI003076AEDD
MFEFFSKKKFLVDYLENFVDMHNHILPGIDDGAKTVEESIALIRSFSEFGVKNFIATPHIMDNYYPNTSQSIHAALDELKKGLYDHDLKHVLFDVSAEHMIDANFETLLDSAEMMPLRKNYLLVEMSYLQPSINFDEAIQKIASKRFFPILAHPERYNFLHLKSSKFKKYKKKGILFQMNLLSLSEFYGKEVQKKALHLLDEGLIDFVASDVHNQNQIQSLKEIKLTNALLELVLPLIDRTIHTFY